MNASRYSDADTKSVPKNISLNNLDYDSLGEKAVFASTQGARKSMEDAHDYKKWGW